jgi:hypothetical protein
MSIIDEVVAAVTPPVDSDNNHLTSRRRVLRDLSTGAAIAADRPRGPRTR